MAEISCQDFNAFVDEFMALVSKYGFKPVGNSTTMEITKMGSEITIKFKDRRE